MPTDLRPPTLATLDERSSVEDDVLRSIRMDLDASETMDQAFLAYDALVAQDPSLEPEMSVVVMKTLLAKVVSADDSPMDMQQRLGEFAQRTYSQSRPSLDTRHLSFINSTFHDTYALFTSITENDPRRLFLVQLCSTLSEYYFNLTSPADDNPDTIASIAYCRDAWLRFMTFARVDTPTPDLALMACIWKTVTRLCTMYRSVFTKSEAGLPASLYRTLEASVESQVACLSTQLGLLEIATSINLIKTLRLLVKAYVGLFGCFADSLGPNKYNDRLDFLSKLSANIFEMQLRLGQHKAEIYLMVEVLRADAMTVLSKVLGQPRLAHAPLKPWCRVQLESSHVSSTADLPSFFRICILLQSHTLLLERPELIVVSRTLDQLMQYFRSVTAQIPTTRRSYLSGVLIEPVIMLALSAPPPAEVFKTQLQLLSYSFHPNVYQQHLCQLVWRHVFQTTWKDSAPGGVAFVDCLLKMLTAPFQAFPQPSDNRFSLLDLLASIFDVLSPTQQTQCLSGAVATFEGLCGDGPEHQVTPAFLAHIDMLEHLLRTTAGQAHAASAAFVATHLSVSMECFGTAVEFLADGTEAELENAFWRIIDATLLVCANILFGTGEVPHVHRELIGDAASWMQPLVIKLVELLARQPPRAEEIFHRVLSNAMELIWVLHRSLKTNSGNYYLALLQHVQHIAATHASAHVLVAHFMHVLADVQVPSDAPTDHKMVGDTLCAIFSTLLQYPSPWPVVATALRALHKFLASSNVADSNTVAIHELLLRYSLTLHDFFAIVIDPPAPSRDFVDGLGLLMYQQDSVFEKNQPTRHAPLVKKRAAATIDDLLETCHAIKRLHTTHKSDPQTDAAFEHAASALQTVLDLHIDHS
ncbi:hypothetical protein SDRG_15114 [Saprolegnia diclina VS20]|uniref:Uncharacterized protein n=1 Tax=Saprolegnia diclina (strain VS20) TaxID=1156394 RepID=T0PXY0_SAPDV|nr:hypothetical protein SDRG_15114 [Saprolegnia diclina VS20]EQC27106.1 hypothetical protein SDRG_15114 [Saprolegnia diclina VS20]|eukprot:XP_008619500.1 hypothetical protein SDRG_15114 [Saprolegnia diclina VS20]